MLAWALRLSSLVAFISETNLLGFKAGAAITIATTQLPKLFGVPGGGEHFVERVSALAGQLPETNLAVLGFGLAAIAVLLLGERFLPGRPIALVVVVGSVVALSVTPLAGLGFKTVGALPSGLPELHLPSSSLADVQSVIPLAFACFLLAYIESVSAARALAQKNGYEIDPRQELLGLGAANLAASLGQGYPVAGGLSQSSVNDQAGARSPLALVFASITIALVSAVFDRSPAQPAERRAGRDRPGCGQGSHQGRGLATAVAGEPARVRRVDGGAGRRAAARYPRGRAAGGSRIVAHAAAGAARPHVASLGRIPGTRRYSDIERHPDNEPTPGALLIRVESSLLYFNADHVRDTVRLKLRTASEPVRLVVFDLSTSPHVDVTGVLMLSGLQRELAAAGVAIRFVEARAEVRDLLRSGDTRARVGEVDRRISLDDVVREFELSPERRRVR